MAPSSIDSGGWNPYQAPTSPLTLPTRNKTPAELSWRHIFVSLAINVVLTCIATATLVSMRRTFLPFPPGICNLIVNSIFILCWGLYTAKFRSLKTKQGFMQSIVLSSWLSTIGVIVGIAYRMISKNDQIIFLWVYLGSAAVTAVVVLLLHWVFRRQIESVDSEV